jgi:hypothetical protein
VLSSQTLTRQGRSLQYYTNSPLHHLHSIKEAPRLCPHPLTLPFILPRFFRPAFALFFLSRRHVVQVAGNQRQIGRASLRFRLVSKFENELHERSSPSCQRIGMDTSSGGKKPEVTKDPWVTTGCPGDSAHVHYQRTTGEGVGNTNGQDKWEGQAERV